MYVVIRWSLWVFHSACFGEEFLLLVKFRGRNNLFLDMDSRISVRKESLIIKQRGKLVALEELSISVDCMVQLEVGGNRYGFKHH